MKINLLCNNAAEILRYRTVKSSNTPKENLSLPFKFILFIASCSLSIFVFLFILL